MTELPVRYCGKPGKSDYTGGRAVICSSEPGHDGRCSWDPGHSRVSPDIEAMSLCEPGCTDGVHVPGCPLSPASCTDYANLMPPGLEKVIVIAAAMMKSTVGSTRARGQEILRMARDARAELSRLSWVEGQVTTQVAGWRTEAGEIRRESSSRMTARGAWLDSCAEEIEEILSASHGDGRAPRGMVMIPREDLVAVTDHFRVPADAVQDAVARIRRALG